MEKHIQAPLVSSEIRSLKAGDYVYITGTIYTARDAAHKRIYETLLEGDGNIPVDLENNIIYYMGPSPARPGHAIGSAGPTTSSRMDKYAPMLLDRGLKGMIGKGKRSPEVIEAIKKNGAVYFAAVGQQKNLGPSSGGLPKSVSSQRKKSGGYGAYAENPQEHGSLPNRKTRRPFKDRFSSAFGRTAVFIPAYLSDTSLWEIQFSSRNFTISIAFGGQPFRVLEKQEVQVPTPISPDSPL